LPTPSCATRDRLPRPRPTVPVELYERPPLSTPQPNAMPPKEMPGAFRLEPNVSVSVPRIPAE